MASRGQPEDLARVRAIAIRDEHRIARIVGVEDQTAAVRRPGDVGRVIPQEGSRNSSHERYEPQALIRLIPIAG